jgi:hypothetical protein
LFKNKLWTIIVCDGKRNLKPRYDTIRSLNIPNLQVIPIYDSDGSSPLNLSNNDIVFDGKIENNFFEVEGENYKIKDNLLEIKLVCKDALWCRILNGSKNSIENIRSLSTKTNINEIIDKLKTKLGEILVE